MGARVRRELGCEKRMSTFMKQMKAGYYIANDAIVTFLAGSLVKPPYFNARIVQQQFLSKLARNKTRPAELHVSGVCGQPVANPRLREIRFRRQGCSPSTLVRYLGARPATRHV